MGSETDKTSGHPSKMPYHRGSAGCMVALRSRYPTAQVADCPSEANWKYNINFTMPWILASYGGPLSDSTLGAQQRTVRRLPRLLIPRAVQGPGYIVGPKSRSPTAWAKMVKARSPKVSANTRPWYLRCRETVPELEEDLETDFSPDSEMCETSSDLKLVS